MVPQSGSFLNASMQAELKHENKCELASLQCCHHRSILLSLSLSLSSSLPPVAAYGEDFPWLGRLVFEI